MKTPFPFLRFSSNGTTPKIEHQAFIEAFLPNPDAPDCPAPVNLTMAWIEWSTVAIRTLIDFRSKVHQWQARGQMPTDEEFHAEAEKLRLAGLDGFFDHLMAVGVMVTAIEEVSDGHK